MGALVDQCPECGKFVAKGSAICPHCEMELPTTVEPADPVPELASGAGPSLGVARALGGAVVGATLAVIALTAGAGDVATTSDDPTTPRDEAAVADEPTEPPATQPPQTASSEAKPSEPREPKPVLSREQQAQLSSTIAAIRAELSTWPERYQIGHSDLSEIRRELDELEQLIDDISSRKE